MITPKKLFISIATLMAVSIVLAPPAFGLQWHIETVDSAGDVGWSPSLAVGADGTVHIAYGDQTTYGDIRYARRSGSGWQIETVDQPGTSGYSPSLAIDSVGNPHVSYYDWTSTDLKYAAWTSAGWAIQTVDAPGNVGSGSSIRLDSLDRPHIAYQDATNRALKYARLDDAGMWRIVPVDSNPAGKYGWSPSLALSTSDLPHIAYCDPTTYELRYARWTDTTWAIESVGWEDENDGVADHSLQLDAANRPHISYRFSSLKYAAYNGTSWVTETVDPGVYAGIFSSLALDADGNPHISYMEETALGGGYYDQSLKYAYWNGATWVTEYVDSGGKVGWFSSLALDSSGLAHIGYYDMTNKDLKYAVQIIPEPTSILVLCAGLGALAIRRRRR